MLKKRSFTLSGHRTSVALEVEFWAVIDQAAARDSKSLAALVAQIDASRAERPLASALRLYALAAKQQPASSPGNTSMLTLYHHPRTRSSRFIFLLEELGVPYEIHRIANLRRPDGSGGVDPENPHPHGKSPALKDGDTLVWESTAIALYLTDRFPQNGLGPVVGDARRGAYVSWLAYYAGVMEPAWMSAYMKWEIPRGTAGWVQTGEVMDFVNATLADSPYILGDRFSAIDILVGTTFKMFMGSPMLEKTDLLETYVNRVTSRPAYARAQAKENG